MKDKGQTIINQFLTRGKGHYYLNIVCANPNFNRSYEIPKRIIDEIVKTKIKQFRKWLEKFGEEKDYEKFAAIFGEE